MTANEVDELTAHQRYKRREIGTLVGATILEVVCWRDPYEPDQIWEGLKVRMKNGQIRGIYAARDPEHNGPGYLGEGEFSVP